MLHLTTTRTAVMSAGAGGLSRRGFNSGMAAALSALLVPGCLRRKSGTLAVIPKTTAIDYWENLHAGAQSAAAHFHMRVFWNAPQSETNYAQQALMVEDLIRQHVDGIVLAPSHGSVLASAVRHARADGIPLVLVDSPASTGADEYVAYIGSDSSRMGTLAAERMGKVLEGRGEIAVLGVSPTVENAVQRERAFVATISRQFPNVRIADVRYGLSDHVRSREIAADILSHRPNLRAIFASDPFSVRGALIALRSHPGRHVRLIGVAQETDLLGFVEQGEVDSLVVQDPHAMGVRAVEILGAAIDGGYSGPRRIETPVALASRENLRTPQIQELVSRRQTV